MAMLTVVPEGARRRGIAFALGIVLLQTAVMAANFGVIAPRLLAGGDPFDPSARTFLLFLVVAPLEAVLVVGAGLRLAGGFTLADLGWRRRDLGRDVAVGLGGFGVNTGITLVLLAVVAGAHPIDVLRDWTSAPADARGLWLLIGMQAAFVEESVFRGALQPALVTRFGRWPGIFLCAAVFSLYHLPRAPVAFLARFLFGAVFGVLRDRTGGLTAPATAHVLMWAFMGPR